MKILIDLKNTANNYDYKNKEDLQKILEDGLDVLCELYNNDNSLDDSENIRLYDMIDILREYEIVED